jgi:hypothetical protein
MLGVHMAIELREYSLDQLAKLAQGPLFQGGVLAFLFLAPIGNQDDTLLACQLRAFGVRDKAFVAKNKNITGFIEQIRQQIYIVWAGSEEIIGIRDAVGGDQHA